MLFVRMALNALDGMMARELDMQSHTGAFLNELGDVLSDAALYLPLASCPASQPILVVRWSCSPRSVKWRASSAVQVGASRRYDGPMGKSDRAFVFGAMGLVLGLGIEAGAWVSVVLWIVIALLLVTIVETRASRGRGGAAMSEIHPNVLLTLVGISRGARQPRLITWVLGRTRPNVDLGEIRARIKSWWVMAAAVQPRARARSRSGRSCSSRS